MTIKLIANTTQAAKQTMVHVLRALQAHTRLSWCPPEIFNTIRRVKRVLRPKNAIKQRDATMILQ